MSLGNSLFKDTVEIEYAWVAYGGDSNTGVQKR